MTLQQAIEKAIKAGYSRPNGSFSLPMKLNDEFDIWEYDTNAILLDPEFWKALGKSMGWDKKLHKDFRLYSEVLPNWQYYWLGLIKHLAAGNSIESYFESLG